jgi:hypothetical protein
MIHVAFWTLVGAIIGEEVGLLPTYEGLKLSLFLHNAGSGHIEVSEALRAVSHISGVAAGAIIGSIAGATVARTEKVGVLHPQRLAILVASIGGMHSMFLPCIHSSPRLRLDGDGGVFLALLVPAMVLAFVGDKRQPLRGGARLGAVIPAGIGALLELGYCRHLLDNGIPPGRGMYVLLGGNASLIVVAWGMATTSNLLPSLAIPSVEPPDEKGAS